MNTSGLILDVYDDHDGTLLKKFFSSVQDMPSFVKTAQQVTAEYRDKLPDDVFALVVQDGEHKIKKYACVDEGNTALSVLYFMENGGKLPEHMQKIAAANLSIACGWYGLQVPADLEKIAMGLGTIVGIPGRIATVQGAIKDAEEADKALKGVPKGALYVKHAEVSGTATAPMSRDTRKDKTPVKVSSDLNPTTKDNTGEKNTPPPQMKPMNMSPKTDACGERPKEVQVKKANHYALGDKYPIDTAEQVKKAAAYFVKHKVAFEPSERRKYAQAVAERAADLYVSIPDEIKGYGGTKYASAESIAMHLNSRDLLLKERGNFTGSEVLHKIAEQAGSLPPELWATVLGEFDKTAGIVEYYDTRLYDPYFVTFADMCKTASESGEKENFSWSEGSHYTNFGALKRLAVHGTRHLKERFDEDFFEEFVKDPVGMFEHLPLAEKRVIATMSMDQRLNQD